MKKIYGFIATASLLALISTPAMAALQTVVAGSTTANVITDGTGGGSGLTKIGLSPNVTIYYDSVDGTAFEVAGYNSKGKFEYGVAADDNNVYMNDMDPDDSGTLTVAGTGIDGTGDLVTAWTLMGGTAAATEAPSGE